MRLETYKMATSIILKFLTLKCDILRTIWRIEVSDGSLFCIFHALSFALNLFVDRTCPLNNSYYLIHSTDVLVINLPNISKVFVCFKYKLVAIIHKIKTSSLIEAVHESAHFQCAKNWGV